MGASAHAHPVVPSQRPADSPEVQHLVMLEWMLPTLVVVAAVAIGIAVLALNRASSNGSLRHDVSALQNDVGSLHAKLAAEQRAVVKAQSKLASLRRASAQAPTAGNVSRLQDNVDQVTIKMRMLQVCVPQLQQEVAGLKLRTSDTNGWLTNAFLERPASVSQACSRALGG